MTTPSASVENAGGARDKGRWLQLVAVLSLIVLAAGLRFYRLGFQSLWLDEAASVAFASGDVPYILRFTFSKEPNPPLYYLLLHCWMPLAGTSEAAVRSLSALTGTASVPLLYMVGRRLLNARAGLLGAAVLAISPFHIWLSQEARAFALLALAALFTLYSLLVALESNRRLWWAAYGVAAFAMMYLHLFGFLALGAFVLLAPVLRLPERRWVRPLAVATAVPVLLYVPWLLSLLNQFGEPQWRARLGLIEIVRQTVKTLPLGEELLWDFSGRGWIAWAALALLPLPFVLGERRLWRGTVAIFAWFTVPILASWLASYVSPIYSPRYLVAIAPAMYLAIGLGIERVSRRFWPVAPLLLALLVATSVPVLGAAYNQPIKEDFRAAARYLAENVGDDDALVIMAGYLEYAFLYYGIDGETPLGDVTTAEQVPPALAPLADAHARLWFVQSHYEVVDPGGHAERWLNERCQKVGERYFTGIRVGELSCPPR